MACSTSVSCSTGNGLGDDHGVLVIVEYEHLRRDIHAEGIALTAITVYHDAHEILLGSDFSRPFYRPRDWNSQLA